MMNQATQDFILQHQDEDVRQLAFLGSKYPEVDMPFALDQIRGRKMARTKLPRWAAMDGIIYPPHISMEQCSSEQTALYKAELAARLLNFPASVDSKKQNNDNSEISEFVTEDAVVSEFAKNEATCFVDLTGGFGVDFSYIAARLGVKSMYVERQAHLCETATENFKRLGLMHAEVRNGDGVEVLHSLKNTNLIFIDPARRDDAGNKVVSLQDCTPDVTQLQDEMLEKADYVIIKLSPMLDWHRAVSELKHVSEVHIVSTGNECKELLLVLSAEKVSHLETREASHLEAKETSRLEAGENFPLRVFCVNDGQTFEFTEPNDAFVSIAKAEELKKSSEKEEKSDEAEEKSDEEEEKTSYLYEPNASLMKAGCFGAISEQYGMKMLAKNSHLFVSDELVPDFPGRSFRIQTLSTFNKKELKRHLAGITKANVATRNFPLSVADLRKRLKLKDGGGVYIFATTLSDESHVLFICSPIRGKGLE